MRRRQKIQVGEQRDQSEQRRAREAYQFRDSDYIQTRRTLQSIESNLNLTATSQGAALHRLLLTHRVLLPSPAVSSGWLLLSVSAIGAPARGTYCTFISYSAPLSPLPR